MGPIETSLRQRAHEIHARLMHTDLPSALQRTDYIRQINKLKSENAILREQIRQITIDALKHCPLAMHQQIIHRIIAMVAEKERVDASDIIGTPRYGAVCFARQICFYLAHIYTNYSLPRIGKIFGGRDHATVLHGRNKIAKLRLTDSILHQRLCYYEKELGHGPIT